MKCCRVLVYVVSRVNVLKAVYIYFVDPVGSGEKDVE